MAGNRYSYAWRRGRQDDLTRFFHACALCGVEDQPFGTHSQLERAHLDGNRKNDDPDNRAVLCRTCHRRHDLPALLLAYRERRADENDAQRPILALLRCDQEIARMTGQQDAPAWLVALGQNDWEVEKRLIQGEKHEI